MISAKEKQLKQETNNNNSNYSKTQIQTPPTENMKTVKQKEETRETDKTNCHTYEMR